MGGLPVNRGFRQTVAQDPEEAGKLDVGEVTGNVDSRPNWPRSLDVDREVHMRLRTIEDDSIESEFLQSWDGVQQFYRSHLHSWRKCLVLLFIASLRRAGYDRKLRAGHSLYSLVLSRSRHYGLSAKQPRVGFEFRGVIMYIVSTDDRGHEDKMSWLPIVLFGPVKKALERLSDQPLS